MRPRPEIPWKRTVAILLLFGTAFGYLEAAVVSYLRILHETARKQFYPGRPPGELFPLLTLDQVHAAGQQQTLAIEIGREAATIVMLASVALAVARNGREWTAAFAISFGVWDAVFYLCLKLLLGWPPSFLTPDILFLIPVTWVGPVAAPLIVSFSMIGAGIWSLARESAGRPLHVRWWNGAGVALGALVIILSFTIATPEDISWAIFGAGMATGLASYFAAV